MVSAPCPALILPFDPPLAGAPDGPLSGLHLVVKDNFDIAGTVTGAGSPEWQATHVPATTTAPIVTRLLDAGVKVVGKAHMDELAYGLMGDNARYGTPLNPAAPGRMPGGSSSGSASAVAGGLADIGLGSDTGGSVRVPAAFCGLWGWRPTHGLLPTAGMVPLAPSYDVPGLMARDGVTLARLVDLLCPGGEDISLSPMVPDDLWARTQPDTLDALETWRRGNALILLPEDLAGTVLKTFQICQGWEVAQQFGDWIRAARPAFGEGVKQRFEAALSISPATARAAQNQRSLIEEHVRAVVGDGRCLILPTVPGPAPALDVSPGDLDGYRQAALACLSVAGHAGLPQITLPLAQVNGAPVGLSVVGPAGSDRALMAFALGLDLSRR